MGIARRGGRHAFVATAALTMLLLALCPCAFSLDPALNISQYAHTAWKIRDGFTKGTIIAIAQTPDGYLWLGTEFGLLRFDGVRAVPWQPPAGQNLPSTNVFSLFTSRDGTLWIGTSKGLASWKNGNLTQYQVLSGQAIRAPMVEDHEGAVWVGGLASPSSGRLCAFRNGDAQCYGQEGEFGSGVSGLFEDSKGTLWVGVLNGLWKWKPGPPKFHSVPGPTANGGGIQGLAEGDDGRLLIGPRNGITRVDAGTAAHLFQATLEHFTTLRLLRDHDHNLWIGTADRGLMRVNPSGSDAFEQSDGLSGDFVSALLIDREGSLWVATDGGLDRFREAAVATLSLSEGLSNVSVLSVLAAKDGSVWFSTRRGLDHLQQGRVTPFSERRTRVQRRVPGTSGLTSESKILQEAYPGSLFQDSHGRIWVSSSREFGFLDGNRFVPCKKLPGGVVYSIAEDAAGTLWIVYKNLGLARWSRNGELQLIPWSKLGHKEHAMALAIDPVRRGIWIGFYQGGIAYFSDDQVRATYTSADGLGGGRVNDLRTDPDGTLWAATEGGLSRLKNGRIATLSSRNGLPCDSVHWSIEDDDRSLWLYSACGLLRITRSDLVAWTEHVDAKNNLDRTIPVTVFDISDGVRSLEDNGGYTPHVAKSSDGRLWFLPGDGVSFLNPRHLPFNSLSPPVHLENVTADRKPFQIDTDEKGLSLPPRVRDLQIDYTALSLVAPEKVLFRYKLEGWDSDWQDAGTRREAFYSNLPPRSYRFRVMACNNSGVWNEVGASVAFFIAPAYYQSTWFRLSCVAALLALLYAFYRLRLYQQVQQFNIRLEERVAERTRIARDLHDSMLQSFQGLMMKFYTLTSILDRPAEARERLEGLLQQGQEAMDEGRNAVRGMRSSTVIQNDLACALATVGERLAGERNTQNPVDFRLEVEGESRDLHPILRDEVYRIASEATRNAFRHSGAGRIEVEICYHKKQLRVRVQDNGKGIDPKVLDGGGREGHYGLPGMQERAKLAGGKLTVRSKLDSGTEVELTIPASIAYAKSPAPSPSIS